MSALTKFKQEFNPHVVLCLLIQAFCPLYTPSQELVLGSSGPVLCPADREILEMFVEVNELGSLINVT